MCDDDDDDDDDDDGDDNDDDDDDDDDIFLFVHNLFSLIVNFFFSFSFLARLLLPFSSLYLKLLSQTPFITLFFFSGV